MYIICANLNKIKAADVSSTELSSLSRSIFEAAVGLEGGFGVSLEEHRGFV